MKTIVVYGHGPQDSEELTPMEKLNIEAAAKLFPQLDQEKVKVILTGGHTGKSYLAEAEVMQKQLILKGIPKECIILEDKATNTIENVVFVTNIAERVDIDYFIHLSIRHHLPRIKEICSLIGTDTLSEYKASEEILGENHQLVKDTKEAVKVWAVNKERWIRGLKEIPEYWLPQAMQIENVKRCRCILSHERIRGWLKNNFSISDVKSLSDKEIAKIREKIKRVKRIVPKET
ncbi:MAG: YdcF family protein [Candidatus Aminicenantia bacterium]